MSASTVASQLLQDLRYGLRTMAANPLFASMAALSLALGIGANTAIYSFMDSILMRSLPVAHPESLVMLNLQSKDSIALAHSYSGSSFKETAGGQTSLNLPFATLELLRQSDVLSTLFGFSRAGQLNVLGRGRADLASGQYVTGDFFAGIAVPPSAGRMIDTQDDRAGGPAVAVLSQTYALQRFGDPAKAVGESLLVNNLPFTVIGVAAPDFFGVDPSGPTEIYLPMQASPLLDLFSKQPRAKFTDNNYYWLELMGRLRPGVSIAQAQAALAPRFHQWVETTATKDAERADLPALIVKEGAGGLDYLRRQYSKPLYVLITMVVCLLLIACANIADLLLARATARRREIALRLSLGAGRSRVVRQLLTESLLLAGTGAALGILFAKWGIAFLTWLIANGRDNFTLRAELNWRVLGVAVALALATGLLFGLAPALQATRVDLVSSLKDTRAGQPRLRWRGAFMRISLSQVLVVGQVAICVLLLVAAGLFVHTLSNLNSIQLGFNRENVLLFSVNAKQAGYRDQALVRYYQSLQSRLASMPGVRGVTATSYAMVSQSMTSRGTHVLGVNPGKDRSVALLSVAGSFFETMQIPILLGREIIDRDQQSPSKVAVVNEVFAKKYFPNGNPIGRRFGFGDENAPTDIEIVGVARTARLTTLKRDTPPVAYLPFGQDISSLGGMNFELRTAGDPLSLANSARQVVRQLDERIPVVRLTTQSAVIDQTISQEHTFATLCTAFAVLAVLIACVGLYGTMAYAVARRTNELGLRLALGAQRRSLLWMVMRQVLSMALIGLAIGVPAAWATAHVVESFLFGIKAKDPLALSLAPAILLIAALVAGYAPAWRASRIDPWKALREE
jgi:predicted permease